MLNNSRSVLNNMRYMLFFNMLRIVFIITFAGEFSQERRLNKLPDR